MSEKKVLDQGKLTHDINSSVSALELAVNLIKSDWDKNPELVTKVIDLSVEKLQFIKSQLPK